MKKNAFREWYSKNPIEVNRRAKGMTRAQVAASVAVSRTTVNNWVQGLSLPSPDNVVKLCEVFGKTGQQFRRDLAEWLGRCPRK